MWLVTTDSFPGYWGRGDTLPEAVANARGAGGKAPWVARRITEGWTDPGTDGLNIFATYTGDNPKDAPRMVAESFRISKTGVIK